MVLVDQEVAQKNPGLHQHFARHSLPADRLQVEIVLVPGQPDHRLQLIDFVLLPFREHPHPLAEDLGVHS